MSRSPKRAFVSRSYALSVSSFLNLPPENVAHIVVPLDQIARTAPLDGLKSVKSGDTSHPNSDSDGLTNATTYRLVVFSASDAVTSIVISFNPTAKST